MGTNHSRPGTVPKPLARPAPAPRRPDLGKREALVIPAHWNVCRAPGLRCAGTGENMMPVILFWSVPAVIAVGVTGYYLVAVSKLVDTALALAVPTDLPSARRRQFRVIKGGKAA